MTGDISKQEWVNIWICVIIPFIVGIVLAFFLTRILFGSSSYYLIEDNSHKGLFFIFLPVVAYYYLVKMPMKWYQSQYHDSFPNFFDNEHGPGLAIRTFLTMFLGTLIAYSYSLLELTKWIDIPVAAFVVFLAFYNMYFKNQD